MKVLLYLRWLAGAGLFYGILCNVLVAGLAFYESDAWWLFVFAMPLFVIALLLWLVLVITVAIMQKIGIITPDSIAATRLPKRRWQIALGAMLALATMASFL